MAYVRVGRDDVEAGFLGCGPRCRCAACRLGGGGLAERYVLEEEEELSQPAHFGGLGRAVSAGDPRTNAPCRADERRIRPVIEPPPHELVTLASRYSADPSRPKLLHRAAHAAYTAMKAAAEAAGIPANLLTVTSGYRSVAHQQRLWADALKRYGSPEAARKWVAPPGGSPHHTGRAVDFWLGTRNSSANIAALRATLPYRWLVCNAPRFGFFPYAAEPWHWEYNPGGVISAAPRPAAPPPPGPGSAAASEAQLIVDAVRNGVRDENRLTNIVFDARHPERRGRPLRQDEQPLVREWLDIRARVVRPGLGRAAPARPAPAEPPAGLDPRQKLRHVHPELARRVMRMAQALAGRGVQIRVTSGLRTFPEQDALYAQGRTAPGNIVTRARAGYSNHNYGLAVDVAPLIDNRLNWNPPEETWQAIGEEGKRAGLHWGGDWKSFVDRPHFELPVGMGVQECLRIYQRGRLPAVWEEASRRLRQAA